MTSKTDIPSSARIEVFRPGDFTSMEGAKLSYTSADLKALAASYDPETAPVPVVVGHPSTDAPAYAWADRFEYDDAADRLSAVLKDIEPTFAAAVKAGRYKKVSLSMFHPHHPANPTPGSWYPKHIGFLGAAAPAVSGLKNVAFSIDAKEAITFEASFSEPGFERAAGLFRRFRDYLISEIGLEEADKVLPSYEIEWLSEAEVRSSSHHIPSYAAAAFNAAAIISPKKKETDVSDKGTADFAAREADLAAREQSLKDRERGIAHGENVSFAEQMIGEGRLLPASKDKVVAILDALPADQTVSFAAGEAPVATAQAIRDVLAAQPKVVTFGALDLGEGPGTAKTATFASDGKPVDQAGLELDAKARAYIRDHPGTPYLDAVQAVS